MSKYQTIQIKENFFMVLLRRVVKKLNRILNGHEILEGYWHVTVKDKNGKVKSKQSVKAQSYVRGFVDLLYANMLVDQGNNQTFVDTAGSNATFDASDFTSENISPDIEVLNPNNTSTYGIQIGSSNTAVAIGDNALGSILTSNIAYSAMSIATDLSTSGTKRFFKLNRSFTNNTGSDVTIEEVGLVALTTVDISAGIKNILIERSLVSQTVSDTDSVLIEYEIKVEL